MGLSDESDCPSVEAGMTAEDFETIRDEEEAVEGKSLETSNHADEKSEQ